MVLLQSEAAPSPWGRIALCCALVFPVSVAELSLRKQFLHSSTPFLLH